LAAVFTSVFPALVAREPSVLAFEVQFDDLVWPQLARNEFQILALEAADKAVRAPIIIPTDVTDVAFGPDATIQDQ